MEHRTSDAIAAAMVTRWLLILSAICVPLATTSIFAFFLGTSSGRGPLVLAMMLPLLGFVALHWRHTFLAIRASPEFFFLLGFVILSCGWSVVPALSVERMIPFAITSLFAMVLGSYLPPRQLIIFFAIAIGFSSVMSFLAIFGVPSSQGIGKWVGAWNGVHNHKNGLGMAATTAIVVGWSAALFTTGRVRWAAIGLVAMGLILLVGAQSRTSQLIAVILMVALAIGMVYRRFALLWAAGFFAFVVILIGSSAFLLGSSLADPIFEVLGRKPTLSGRLPLWSVTWEFVQAKPWLGHGYQGFWRPDASYVIAMAYNPLLFFSPHYSHNGVIEVLLAVGWIGFALLVFVLGRTFASLFLVMRHSTDRLPAMCLFIIIIGLLTQNITESFMLAPNATGWIFLVASILCARRMGAEVKIGRFRQSRGMAQPA